MKKLTLRAETLAELTADDLRAVGAAVADPGMLRLARVRPDAQHTAQCLGCTCYCS